MKAVKLLVAVMVVGSLAGTAWAGEERPSPQERRAAARAFAAELDIRPEQKQEIARILKGYRPQLAAAADRVAGARKDLRSAAAAEAFSESAVRLAHKSVAAQEEELAVLRARVAHEVRGVLTPEQRQKLAERRAASQDRIEGGLKNLRILVDHWIDENLAG